jgi:membrane metallo-endopeptidase-like protein 1
LSIDENEPIIVFAPVYLQNLNTLIEEYQQTNKTKIILSNYMVWHTVYYYSNFLNEKYRLAKSPLSQATRGSSGIIEKWKECIEDVDMTIGFALGAMFVEEAFKGSSKENAGKMILNIRNSFEANIRNVSWMDEDTRKMALEKVSAVIDMIGYPDFINNVTLLDRHYKDLQVSNDTYFENVLNSTRFGLKRNLRKLRQKVNKKKWDMTPPQVNAYYEPTKNEMVFPAGILQVPFYDADYPKVNSMIRGTMLKNNITNQ